MTDLPTLNDSLLFISARSPFARRTRLALQEHGIRHEERVFDVFKPNPELIAVNPLARVPVLQFKTGEVLFESEKILSFLYRAHPRSPLIPANDADWIAVAHWSAVAMGLMEKTVEYYLETLRPEAARDQELLDEVRDIATRVFERFEPFIADRDCIAGSSLSQADLDMGAALAYFTLRYSATWKNRFSKTDAYLRKLEERPSFQATRPPAA